MCEYTEKLVAWLDRELPPDEAVRLERHLDGCSECPRRVAAYEEVSTAFAGYCDSVISVASKRQPRWSVLAAAGAVAAGLLLLSIFPRTPVVRITIPPPPPISPPSIAFKQAPLAARSVARRSAYKPVRVPNAARQFFQPEFQIAIPADAIFPPGAVPEGFQFVADISIGADGAAQTLRLRTY